MTVLVTGSSGFLGVHLCSSLERAGHHVIEYDLSQGLDIMNEELMFDIITARGVTDVIHLAAVADLYIAEENPELAVLINVEGTRRVLSACDRAGAQMLFASTCCAYGNNGVHPSREDSPLSPEEIYAETKAEAEGVISDSPGDHTIMRLATFYGPGQRGSLATSVFLERSSKGEPLLIHGSGEQTRTFTHVDDIVSGILHILRAPVRPKVVNVSIDESYSVNELAATCMRLTKVVDVSHIADRPGQIHREEIDNSMLRSLGWEPKYNLQNGLATCLGGIRRILFPGIPSEEVLAE